jgi:hypothetical protein
MFYKLMSIQSNSTILMLEEFIWDLNKLVKTSLLIMLQEEKNYANFSEIKTELASTLMLILKLWKELNKPKEKQLKLLEESKTQKKALKNLRKIIQPSIKCHYQLMD